MVALDFDQAKKSIKTDKKYQAAQAALGGVENVSEIPHRGAAAYEATMPIADSSLPIPRVGYIDIKRVHATTQPRKDFNEAEMKSLVESIKRHGILQPVLVRLAADKLDKEPQYYIVFGERRWRAAREAGLKELPVIMRETLNDADSYELALTENINRDDLTVLEECDGILELQKRRGYTVLQLMHQLGKGKGWVENRLNAAKAGDDVKTLLAKYPDALSHVIYIDKVKEPRLRKKLIEETEGGASVSAIRKIIEESKPQKKQEPPATSPTSSAPARPVESQQGSVSNGSHYTGSRSVTLGTDVNPEYSAPARDTTHLAPILNIEDAETKLKAALSAIKDGKELTGDWRGVLGKIRLLVSEIEGAKK